MSEKNKTKISARQRLLKIVLIILLVLHIIFALLMTIFALSEKTVTLIFFMILHAPLIFFLSAFIKMKRYGFYGYIITCLLMGFYSISIRGELWQIHRQTNVLLSLTYSLIGVIIIYAFLYLGKDRSLANGLK